MTKKTDKKAGKGNTASAVSKQSAYTPQRLAGLKPFQPGQSGNPKGRAKGSRNELSEEFIAAFYADFKEYGPQTVAKVREERPHEYLKVAAGLLPKELNIKTEALEELSEDELAAILAKVRSDIAAALREEGGESTAEGTRH